MIDRAIAKTTAALQIVAGALLLTLFTLNVVQIGLRYFLGAALIWLPDLSRLLFVWLVFIGASVLVARNGHLVMDFFTARLTAASRNRAQLVIQIGQIGFFVVMLVWGTRIFLVRLDIPFDTWEFPTGWAYLAVPASALLMIIFAGNALLTMLTRTGANDE
jgi:TRAP-type transport system small permease protein